jgi:hypothetical protein
MVGEDARPDRRQSLVERLVRAAGFDDHADWLMTQHDRRAALDVPVEQIAAADSAGAHLDEDLAWARPRPVQILDPNVTRGVVDGGFHR